MKSATRLTHLCALLLCAAAPAAWSADVDVWLSGSDEVALHVAQQLLSDKGLGAMYSKGNDIPPGVYVAMPTFNKAGKDMDHGYAVAGGATALVVFYHCTRYVDLFVGRWTSGYYGYESSNELDRDILRMNTNAMTSEIAAWLESDYRSTTEQICKKYVKPHA